MAMLARPGRESLRELRDRPPVVALAVVFVVAATILVTLSTLASIDRAREDVRRHAAMFNAAHTRVAQITSGATNAAPAPSGALPDAIERVLRDRGIAYRRAAGDAQAPGMQGVVIDAVPFDALVNALDALAREQRVRAVEANVAARVERGVVRAELLLAR